MTGVQTCALPISDPFDEKAFQKIGANYEKTLNIDDNGLIGYTTTITGSLADSTILFTLKMLFTEPTDVPPNFITFMKIHI